jgi:hypothetical protein
MSSQTDTKSFLEIRRSLPVPLSEGQSVPQRGGRYGETYCLSMTSRDLNLADEGTVFIASNPTPGTGLATITALTTLVDTSPFLLVQNQWQASDPQSCRHYPVLIKLQVTAPGTAGTQIRYAVKTDQARSDRYTSGGTTLVSNPCNYSNSSKSVAYAGAIVAATAPQAKLLGNGLIRPVIPVIGDTYTINFGGIDVTSNSLAVAGTAIANVNNYHPPVSIGPQEWLAFHIWLPSQSAASSYEVEYTFIER